MSEQDNQATATADRIYRSLSRQLRCGNPVVFARASYRLVFGEHVGLSEDDLECVRTTVSNRLTADRHAIAVSYDPESRLFTSTPLTEVPAS